MTNCNQIAQKPVKEPLVDGEVKELVFYTIIN